MKIATFNINSIRARIENLRTWLETEQPDVVLLQEIKCQDEQFPTMEIQAMGYHSTVHGQKSYNGVAILSKEPILNIVCGLPGGGDDEQARYIEATISNKRICGLYLPNGNPVSNEEKFAFKLKWMDRLGSHIKNTLLPMDMPLIIGGDFNVIPKDTDCLDPSQWVGDAATMPQTRKRFRSFQNLGLTEIFTALNPKDTHAYTFWDYQRGCWQKNDGIRIDFFLTNGYATDMSTTCWVDKKPRGEEKASDHTPLILELDT